MGEPGRPPRRRHDRPDRPHTRPDPTPATHALRAPHRRAEGADHRSKLAAGDSLPTFAEIAVTHHVSVGTAQRAVAQLKTEGLVDVQRGRRATVTNLHQTKA
ncbi:MAG: GntR family transcriptional regulator [Nocardioidaceae bacterium]